MKRLFAILFAALSLGANASTAKDICEHMTRLNHTYGAECFDTIKGKYFADLTLVLAEAYTNYGFLREGTNVLKAGADRKLDPAADRMCRGLAVKSIANGFHCVEIAYDGKYDLQLTSLATLMATKNVPQSLQMMEVIKNQKAQASAVQVCKLIAAEDAESALTCTYAVIAHTYKNGAELVCMGLAKNRQYEDAANCMFARGTSH